MHTSIKTLIVVVGLSIGEFGVQDARELQQKWQGTYMLYVKRRISDCESAMFLIQGDKKDLSFFILSWHIRSQFSQLLTGIFFFWNQFISRIVSPRLRPVVASSSRWKDVNHPDFFFQLRFADDGGTGPVGRRHHSCAVRHSNILSLPWWRSSVLRK